MNTSTRSSWSERCQTIPGRARYAYANLHLSETSYRIEEKRKKVASNITRPIDLAQIIEHAADIKGYANRRLGLPEAKRPTDWTEHFRVVTQRDCFTESIVIPQLFKPPEQPNLRRIAAQNLCRKSIAIMGQAFSEKTPSMPQGTLGCLDGVINEHLVIAALNYSADPDLVAVPSTPIEDFRMKTDVNVFNLQGKSAYRSPAQIRLSPKSVTQANRPVNGFAIRTRALDIGDPIEAARIFVKSQSASELNRSEEILLHHTHNQIVTHVRNSIAETPGIIIE